MAEVTNELMYEILKSIHAEVRGLKEWRVDVNNEFNSLRAHHAAMQGDVNALYSKLASLETRFDRIDQRLDLVELPSLNP